MRYLSQNAAALVVSPNSPPSRDTLQRWHDFVGGPRDSYGRRIWTDEICDQVRTAMAARHAVLNARDDEDTLTATRQVGQAP